MIPTTALPTIRVARAPIQNRFSIAVCALAPPVRAASRPPNKGLVGPERPPACVSIVMSEILTPGVDSTLRCPPIKIVVHDVPTLP
jgi:hypothetical protein